VKYNLQTKAVAVSEVENHIKYWLRMANERDGGRKARDEQKKTNTR
jgi:hypothetical protein